MEPVTMVRPNGSGFMHLQRSLQPGERVPTPLSLAAQLLACKVEHRLVEAEADTAELEMMADDEDDSDEV